VFVQVAERLEYMYIINLSLDLIGKGMTLFVCCF